MMGCQVFPAGHSNFGTADPRPSNLEEDLAPESQALSSHRFGFYPAIPAAATSYPVPNPDISAPANSNKNQQQNKAIHDARELHMYHLKEAVLEGGIPFNKAHGMTSFDYHGTDLRFNKVFNNAMSNHSTITMKKVLNTYKGFEGLTSLVDVGGVGATPHMIVSNYPSIRGFIFDLPHVLADAPLLRYLTHQRRHVCQHSQSRRCLHEMDLPRLERPTLPEIP
ncbi:hypothetical protein NE237_013024 [Protea cynaroides]|uniref:O-methyltransferase C-terminal domain-containing protein n=1 Tax=Protea cynaroides TaxID=273540 RepID=A0A9Q0GXV7_9MAGN|nr:hypothetical protein NE237_013024 [Protea cynaroides]